MAGMDTMMATLFKAMGFNPAEMAEGIQQFIGHVYQRLDEFDARMQAQENLMRQVADMIAEGNRNVEQGEARGGSRGDGDQGAGSDGNRGAEILRLGGPGRATGTDGG